MAGLLLARLVQDDSGATAIEYGFIAGGVSIAAAAVWNVIGFQLVLLSAHIATALGFSGAITAG